MFHFACINALQGSSELRRDGRALDADVSLDAAFGCMDDIEEEELVWFIGEVLYAGLTAW